MADQETADGRIARASQFYVVDRHSGSTEVHADNVTGLNDYEAEEYAVSVEGCDCHISQGAVRVTHDDGAEMVLERYQAHGRDRLRIRPADD